MVIMKPSIMPGDVDIIKSVLGLTVLDYKATVDSMSLSQLKDKTNNYT